MHHPQPILTCALWLSLHCLDSGAQALLDSGYGDGSLVDAQGHYFYPQAGGGYMDSYGSTYQPVGAGIFSDAIGNTIDAGEDGAPPGPSANLSTRAASAGLDEGFNQPPDAAVPTDNAPSAIDGEPPELGWSSGRNETPEGATVPVTVSPGGAAEFGSMYLEDAGDGYTKIDAGALPADPRASKPAPTAGTRDTQRLRDQSSLAPAASDFMALPRAPDTTGISDQRHLPAIDLTPLDRKVDDSARFKGNDSPLNPSSR